MAESDPQEIPEPQETGAEQTGAEPTVPTEGRAGGRSMRKSHGTRRTRTNKPPALPPSARTFMTAEEAAAWFVSDLMEVSGFVRLTKRYGSGYSHYRPILTKPDPWYFAGLVALEASKIIDLFPQQKADAILREVLLQADAAGARHEVKVSSVVLGVMGRLGMGQLLLHGKVPDYLIAKVMRMLLGSAKNAVRLIPNKDAHEQVTSALKIGNPVWWRMFVRRFDIRIGNEPVAQPKLVPIVERVGEAPEFEDLAESKPAEKPAPDDGDKIAAE